MLTFEDEALVLTALPHGENGAVVRFLSMQGGLRSGFVAGARGKAKRAVLHPGNRVELALKARAEGQLASATVELVESRALLAFEPQPAAILAWLTAISAAALAEEVPHPRLAGALDALLSGLAAGLTGSEATSALARYELLLLEEEGFGLDLSACALGGSTDDLAFVSPKSGRAVSRAQAAGQPWERQLLPLPGFLLHGGGSTVAEAAEALALTGHFLARHWLHGELLEGLRRRAIAGTSPEQLAARGEPPKASP
ncbi:DNA repair protein RecO [Sandaracinobacteroides hominis]|uniref:DNA repair protein RecO n=1 Tax=Sandaracinobacteroides hominis TaxID=2780086 RepID=UPI0018F70358|nr:DNA repair protein RecO [Sandaracinobacteroides hominis]